MHAVHILLVEDNEGDILLIREAFEDSSIANTLSVARDGKEALDFLNKKGKSKNADIPDLMLLDINLPKRNGIEVLQYIKRKEAIRHIPVIILTTSSFERDINLSYKNYVNCYITKPVEVERFLDVVTKVENFWTSTATLPTQK